MKRREFVTGVLAAGLAADALAAQGRGHGHGDTPLEGPLANAVVSFGAWPAGLSDRLIPPPPGSPPPPNVHQLLPYTVTIKAGGAVNFVLAGFHHVVVYGPGTTFDAIAAGSTIPVPGAPEGFPRLIDDPTNRVYRGLNPFGQPQDRVEVVHFSNPGTYLVICAFVPHFADKMHGSVKVVK
jgi:plastocyanin